MSVVDRTRMDTDGLDQIAEFDLEFLYDDASAPTEVTVFAPETLDRGATQWLTIDYEHAVSFDEMR